jgi:hypothetical protein
MKVARDKDDPRPKLHGYISEHESTEKLDTIRVDPTRGIERIAYVRLEVER